MPALREALARYHARRERVPPWAPFLSGLLYGFIGGWLAALAWCYT